jgi:hypothetical protein
MKEDFLLTRKWGDCWRWHFKSGTNVPDFCVCGISFPKKKEEEEEEKKTESSECFRLSMLYMLRGQGGPCDCLEVMFALLATLSCPGEPKKRTEGNTEWIS